MQSLEHLQTPLEHLQCETTPMACETTPVTCETTPVTCETTPVACETTPVACVITPVACETKKNVVNVMEWITLEDMEPLNVMDVMKRLGCSDAYQLYADMVTEVEDEVGVEERYQVTDYRKSVLLRCCSMEELQERMLPVLQSRFALMQLSSVKTATKRFHFLCFIRDLLYIAAKCEALHMSLQEE